MRTRAMEFRVGLLILAAAAIFATFIFLLGNFSLRSGFSFEVDYQFSGNIRPGDIGLFLKDNIQTYFGKNGKQITLKYIDPSYMIRSMPANPHDSVFCLLLGHNAVHAGMAGRTNMVVGRWKEEFTHVPIPTAVSRRKQIDPKGRLWSSVLSSTGQPREMC